MPDLEQRRGDLAIPSPPERQGDTAPAGPPGFTSTRLPLSAAARDVFVVGRPPKAWRERRAGRACRSGLRNHIAGARLTLTIPGHLQGQPHLSWEDEHEAHSANHRCRLYRHSHSLRPFGRRAPHSLANISLARSIAPRANGIPAYSVMWPNTSMIWSCVNPMFSAPRM